MHHHHLGLPNYRIIGRSPTIYMLATCVYFMTTHERLYSNPMSKYVQYALSNNNIYQQCSRLVVVGVFFLTCQRDILAQKKECIRHTLRTNKMLDIDAWQCSVTEEVPKVIFVIIPSWQGWWQKLISIIAKFLRMACVCAYTPVILHPRCSYTHPHQKECVCKQVSCKS